MATKIDGLAELQKLLQELPQKVEVNVMRGALRAGQSVIRDRAQQAAPVDQGALRKSIKIKFRGAAKKRGLVRVDLVAGGKAAPHAHLIEYGTASFYSGEGSSVGEPYVIKPKEGGGLLFGGTVRKEVVHPGVKPQPFMRPAADSGFDPAVQAVAGYLRERIPKEIEKAGK